MNRTLLIFGASLFFVGFQLINYVAERKSYGLLPLAYFFETFGLLLCLYASGVAPLLFWWLWHSPPP